MKVYFYKNFLQTGLVIEKINNTPDVVVCRSFRFHTNAQWYNGLGNEYTPSWSRSFDLNWTVEVLVYTEFELWAFTIELSKNKTVGAFTSEL